jgi:hypothetical protein
MSAASGWRLEHALRGRSQREPSTDDDQRDEAREQQLDEAEAVLTRSSWFPHLERREHGLRRAVG